MARPATTSWAGRSVRAARLTSPQAGAIGLIELDGDVMFALECATGKSDWNAGDLRVVRLFDCDHGVVYLPTADRAVLMPHGGMRIVQRMLQGFADVGVAIEPHCPDTETTTFIETGDPVEQMMLETLARAKSPRAIDVLLNQPQQWREATTFTKSDATRSRILNRLIKPPTVVVVGAPNVGKSTLSNRLAGRTVSIEADLPGTTRDFTSSHVNLAGLVVRWVDTPGTRAASCGIEAAAIEAASQVIEQADLVVSMTDVQTDCVAMPETAAVTVCNKVDLGGNKPDADIFISARDGIGIEALVSAVAEAIVPAVVLREPGCWLFDERLREVTPHVRFDA